MAGKAYSFGADAGNSALKLSVEGLKERLYIPSVYAEAIDISYGDDRSEEDVSDILDHLDCTISSPYLSEKKRFVIGNKVVRDNLTASYLPVGVKKSREEFPFVLTLVSLAAAAVKLNPGKKTIKVEYEGSISLPVRQINVEEAAFAERRLIGSHTVIFHLPNQDVTVHLYISFVKCATEAAVAAYGICYDEKGQVKNESYLNAMHMFFDPGDGTTEFAVTVGTQYKKELSDGQQIGVGLALDQTMKVYNMNHDYQLRSRRHVVDILLDQNHAKHDEVKTAAEAPLKQVAQNIATHFTNQLRIAQDVKYIHGLGGGALILREYIQPIMAQRNFQISYLPDPVFANANALLIYTMSPRFQRFKEKYIAQIESAATGE